MIIKRVLSRDRLRTPPASGFSWISTAGSSEMGSQRPSPQPRSCSTSSFALPAIATGFPTTAEPASPRSKLPPQAIEAARRTLERCDLILFREPLYQVLALPASPLPAFDSSKRDSGPQSIADILRGSP